MDEKTNATRRRLLKLGGIAGAAAITLSLPEKWTKPVVEFIVVPAHADASSIGPTTTTPTPTTSEAPTTTTSTTEAPTTTEESTTTTEPP